LILHVPSLSFVRPKILIKTFISNTIDLFFCSFFQTPRFTGVCYCWSYNTPVQFQFWFFRDQSTFKEKLVSVICFISKCYSMLDLFFYWVITIRSWFQITHKHIYVCVCVCVFVSFYIYIERHEHRAR
jgi:hypothetical protein